jgi:gas vesicle protein
MGGVAGYYLNSAEGRKMQKKMKKEATKMRKEMAKSIEAGKEQMVNKVNHMADYTKGKVNELKTSLADTLESAVDTTEELKSKFESGVDKARAKVKEQTRKMRDVHENTV